MDPKPKIRFAYLFTRPFSSFSIRPLFSYPHCIKPHYCLKKGFFWRVKKLHSRLYLKSRSKMSKNDIFSKFLKFSIFCLPRPLKIVKNSKNESTWRKGRILAKFRVLAKKIPMLAPGICSIYIFLWVHLGTRMPGPLKVGQRWWSRRS